MDEKRRAAVKKWNEKRSDGLVTAYVGKESKEALKSLAEKHDMTLHGFLVYSLKKLAERA